MYIVYVTNLLNIAVALERGESESPRKAERLVLGAIGQGQALRALRAMMRRSRCVTEICSAILLSLFKNKPVFIRAADRCRALFWAKKTTIIAIVVAPGSEVLRQCVIARRRRTLWRGSHSFAAGACARQFGRLQAAERRSVRRYQAGLRRPCPVPARRESTAGVGHHG